MVSTTPSASSELEGQGTLHQGQENQGLSPQDIAAIVKAVVQQQIGGKLEKLESKQAEVDATMQQLPALVQQFQSALPQLISQAVQQHMAVALQRIPQASAQPQQPPNSGGAPAGSPPDEEGAGAIPLGVEIPGAAPTPPAQDQGPPQMQVPANNQVPQATQQKASEILRQLAGGGGVPGMGGGANPLGGMLQQVILKKLLGKEEKPPPNMMEQLMGLGQMFEQLTGFFSMVVNAVDSMRGNILEQRHRAAQIDKLEAESQATVLRAMNPSKKTGGSKR